MAISTAVDLSAVARVVGIKTLFKDLRGGNILFLPQRIAVVGHGSTSATYTTTKKQLTSAGAVAASYGYGSPLHLAALQLLPVNGDGVGTIPVTFYPLENANLGVASLGSVTPSGAGTGTGRFVVRVNNIDSEEFTVTTGDAIGVIVAAMVAAVNASLNMPVIATLTTGVASLTAKWKGSSGESVYIEVIPTAANNTGITFAITQPAGGGGAVDVNIALNQVGDVWETLVLNCEDITDGVSLNNYQTFGEGRWGALTRKPLVVFTGNTETLVSAATVVSDSRKADRVNVQLVEPGSNDLPFVAAARQLARIARVANNNPPRDYGSQDATGLTPGADGDQWLYADRDSAVKKGSSTIEVKDGVVNISDVVTFYHPTGDAIPAYRYVVDIVKVQNILFNLDLIFATDEWDGAPLIPDDQPTVNRSAKKPKMAVAAIASMLDSLGLNAIISDPKTAKANTFAVISDMNPKRLDVSTTVQLSGNTNIISIDLNFGFYFGTPQIVA